MSDDVARLMGMVGGYADACCRAPQGDGRRDATLPAWMEVAAALRQLVRERDEARELAESWREESKAAGTLPRGEVYPKLPWEAVVPAAPPLPGEPI